MGLVETALVLSYSQIVEGAASCSVCGAAAAVTLSTGADPEPDPLCWDHARQMISVSSLVCERLFGIAA
jgi:uncharacterized membrane protein YadS